MGITGSKITGAGGGAGDSGILEVADYASLPSPAGTGDKYYVQDAERVVVDHTGISHWVPAQYADLTAAWQIVSADALADLTGRGFTVVEGGTGSVTKTSGNPLTVVGEAPTTYLQCPDHGADTGVLLVAFAGVTSTYACKAKIQAASYNCWMTLGSTATAELKMSNYTGTPVGQVVPRVDDQLVAFEFDLRASNDTCWLWTPTAASDGRRADWQLGGGGLWRYSSAGTRGVYWYGAYPGAGNGTVEIAKAFCLV